MVKVFLIAFIFGLIQIPLYLILGTMQDRQNYKDATYRSHSAALLVPATRTTLSSRAADVREVLTRNARRVRPMLELLLKLDLQGDPQHLVRRSLEWIRFYYKDRIDWVFGHPPIDWTGRWRRAH